MSTLWDKKQVKKLSKITWKNSSEVQTIMKNVDYSASKDQFVSIIKLFARRIFSVVIISVREIT